MERQKPDVTLFTVGEEINPASSFIRIKITAIYPEHNKLEAVVTRAEDFYAERHPSLGIESPFAVGMELIFEPQWPGNWRPCAKNNASMSLPWFELMVTGDGKKVFQHYR